MFRAVFHDRKYSVVWLILRLWLGYEWLNAGFHKVGAPEWTGGKAGEALSAFLRTALASATNGYPIVQPWYASFLERVVIPNSQFFSHLIAWGEVFVGLSLVIGVLTVLGAFVGAVMNLGFMLAGSATPDTYMYTAAVLIIVAGANATFLGLDHYLLPWLWRLLRRGSWAGQPYS